MTVRKILFGDTRGYRDLWMLVITGLVLWSLVSAANDRDERDERILDSRVYLTLEACERDNDERRVQRDQLQESKEQLGRISDEQLEALGFTRTEALSDIQENLNRVQPINCEAQADRVRASGQ